MEAGAFTGGGTDKLPSGPPPPNLRLLASYGPDGLRIRVGPGGPASIRALPWFVFSMIAIGSGAVQLYMARQHPGRYTIPAPQCLIIGGIVLLVFAVWLSRISLTFLVNAEGLQLRWDGIFYSSGHLFPRGTVKDVRVEIVTRTGGRGYQSKCRVLRIEEVSGRVRDYLCPFPSVGQEWIAQTLRAAGVCCGASLG